MENSTTDLQSKYQKLASEYSKIRAQATVLKKAVIDEQTKSADLKDLLKEKEQCLRKADQEMESLNFRNQQLTKRVTVLQEELDAYQQSKSKKGKHSSNDATATKDFSQLVDEQLAKQMTENARLVIQIQETEEEHSRQTQQLIDRVQSLEREVSQLQAASTTVEAKYKTKLSNLQSQKISLHEKASCKERDVQQYNAQVSALELQQQRIKADLNCKLQTDTENILEQFPLTNKELIDLQHQTRSLEVISQVGCFICDLTSQLSDFHTYSEQRLHTIFDSLNPVQLKFSVHLKENAKYLRALEQGYKEFQAGLDSGMAITLQTIPSLNCVADKLEKYNSYLQKLLPYQLLSLDEENLLPTCGDALKSKNDHFGEQTLLFASSFMKITNYVQFLASQSKETQQLPHVCQNRFFEELVKALEALHYCTIALSTTFKEKMQLECDTVSSSEHLQSSNKCLVNSLTAMVITTQGLHTVLLDNKDMILRGITLSGKINQEATTLKSLEQASSPYKWAQQYQDKALGGTSRKEALGEQLQNAQQRLTQLEQDREHWKQEFQLLRMKHAKEQKKNRELQDQLHITRSNATTPQSEDSAEKIDQQPQTASENASPAHSCEVSVDETFFVPSVVTGLLGQISCPFAISGEVEAREQEVKKYFTERINQLVAERQLSDGKAVSLRTECMALHERLQLATAQRSMAKEKLQSAESALVRLQEELHTTTHNYETQLSLMSEHLANMNEKLAVQRDEIDQLKYQLGQKVAKKGKQK